MMPTPTVITLPSTASWIVSVYCSWTSKMLPGRYRRLMLSPVFATAILGCAGVPSSTPGQSSAGTAAPTTPSSPTVDYYFPIHNIAKTNPQMAAQLTGTLLAEGGCLVVKPTVGNELLLIWPRWVQPIEGPPFGVRDEGGSDAVLNGQIKVDGGEIANDKVDYVTELLGGQAPRPDCRRSGYWIVAGIPN